MPDQFAMCFADQGGALAIGDSVSATSQFFANPADPFVYTSILSKSHYSVPLQSLRVGPFVIPNTRVAIVDSGTTVFSCVRLWRSRMRAPPHVIPRIAADSCTERDVQRSSQRAECDCLCKRPPLDPGSVA
jgi:hypothetical protein